VLQDARMGKWGFLPAKPAKAFSDAPQNFLHLQLLLEYNYAHEDVE
jgi:hypothetical protein